MEYRICEKRSNRPRVKQDICQSCSEECEFAGNCKIQLAENMLPATLEELHTFILVGKEKLKAHKAKISAIEKLDLAQAAKDAARSDAQDLGELLIDAEAKLGEMLARIDKTPSQLQGKDRGSKGGTTKKTLPEGITKKESHYAQQIARHPEIVEEAKTKAREKGQIVTERGVLQKIAKSKPKESPKRSDTEYGTKPQGTATEAMDFAIIAISQLERIRFDDPKREKAFDYVEAWIKNNRIKEV